MSASVQVYWVKRINNRRLVRERDPSYVRETAVLVAGALAGLLVLLVVASQHFAFTHAGYRLEELRSRHEQVLEWNRTLRLEQAALLDPMRIDVLARNRLGLAAPRADQVVPLGSGEGPTPAVVLAQATQTTSPRPPVRQSLAD
jgi:cell division protein FtsL